MTRRHPRVLVAAVAASTVLLAGASVAMAVGVDADTRVALRAEITEMDASTARLADLATAALATQETAEACAARSRELLGPVAPGGRFSEGIAEVAIALAEPRTDASATTVASADARLTVAGPPAPPAADAGVDVLRDGAEASAAAQAVASARAEEAAFAGLVASRDCAATMSAVTALAAEVRIKTAEIVAANAKAGTDVLASVHSAQAAVDLRDAGATARWLDAVSAAEVAHAEAVRIEAEAAAAEAAAEAARRAGSSGSGSGTGAATPAPFISTCDRGRQWSVDEVVAAGFPPDAQIFDGGPRVPGYPFFC